MQRSQHIPRKDNIYMGEIHLARYLEYITISPSLLLRFRNCAISTLVPFLMFQKTEKSSPPPPKDISLKLLIDKENHKVVFAEAGKEFVDFLFTLLSFPLSSAIRVCKVGSLSNIYESIDALGDKYMLPNVSKNTIVGSSSFVVALNKLRVLFSNKPLDLKPIIASNAKKFYLCDHSLRPNDPMRQKLRPCVTDDPKAYCPLCGTTISTATTYVAPPGETSLMKWDDGYVRGVASYVIMDDLRVQPVSVFTNLNMLKKYIHGGSGSDKLEEKVVHVDMDQVDKWLKASTESNSVLTDLFLGKKAIASEMVAT